MNPGLEKVCCRGRQTSLSPPKDQKDVVNQNVFMSGDRLVMSSTRLRSILIKNADKAGDPFMMRTLDKYSMHLKDIVRPNWRWIDHMKLDLCIR